jgi:Protein involved in initiation of plasmid replication
MGLTDSDRWRVTMAMQQLTLPGEIVKKHNELVRSKINISNKTASRILACLVAVIRHDDTRFKEAYTVPVKNYLPPDEEGKGGSQYTQVKAACRELIGATVEKEWLDPDNPNGEPIFHVMPFFTSIKYRKGNVEAKFNPEMSELLLQLRQFFTEYNLIEYLTLPSTYSQRLFEILKSWSSLPEKILSIAELHRLLDTPPSFRANFKAFRVRVIEKAHKDIQEKTSLRFEWEPVKAGRSVEAIRFIFSAKRQSLAQEVQEDAKEAKRRRLQTQRMRRALDCAKTKKGDCRTMDNKPIVCKACHHFGFCKELYQNNNNG